MIARRAVAAALALALLAGPIAPARAAGDGGTPGSRVGVALAVACGLSAKVSLFCPVPWAGVAVIACLFTFLDAALSDDNAHSDHVPKP